MVPDYRWCRDPLNATGRPIASPIRPEMSASAERQLRAAGFLELVAVESDIEESASLRLRIADEQSDVALGEPIPALQQGEEAAGIDEGDVRKIDHHTAAVGLVNSFQDAAHRVRGRRVHLAL